MPVRPRSDVWFISDEHYGHAKIISLCGRPFKSVQDMDEALITRHNKLVKDSDTVYHLGDFAYTNKSEYLGMLRGQHILIKGNHDNHVLAKDKAAFFAVYEGGFMFEDAGIAVWLSHYPHFVWPTVYEKPTAHFFGHVHNNMTEQYHPLAINLSVEMWNYAPVKWSKLYSRLLDRFKYYAPAQRRFDSREGRNCRGDFT